MNIICIAAMVIALIIGITIIICVYLKHMYNPSLYQNSSDSLSAVHCIAHTLLDRYEDYHNCEEKDKYNFRIDEKEIIDALTEIRYITEI